MKKQYKPAQNFILMKRICLMAIFCLIAMFKAFSQEKPLSSFYANRGNDSQWLLYQDNHKALYRIITNEAFRLLDQREALTSKLHTEDEWQAYLQKKRQMYGQTLEKFVRTPLNPRITGKLEREDFTVEKIIFESQPGFYVTSALFLPGNLKKPAPVVIYCSGHTELGFRSDAYQKVIINLVRKGFIVFAFDPVGQGERLQYADLQTGKSKIGGPTTEHTYAGVQTLLTGSSLSDYFIWDGVRAIDYLATRKEVDMNRIGITGRSGGGTQSAMIAAFDQRIHAAAPECYITSFRRLLQSIGPQDAEQNPWHFIRRGFDHADFLHLRAPKPALIITTTHDFFSQQGARETYEEVKRSYTALGKPENILFTEDFGTHESTSGNRKSLYAFFRKHLDLPGDTADLDVVPFKVEELWCTPSGQIASYTDGKTVFNLNKKFLFPSKNHSSALKDILLQTGGISFTRKLTSTVYTGLAKDNSYEVKRYFIENSEKDYALPIYVITGKNQTGKLLVWIAEEGKEKVPGSALLDEFIQNGYTVIAADLPGTGELSDPEFRGDGFVKKIPFNYTLGANLVGKTIPGIQAEALDLVLQMTAQKYPGKPVDVYTEGMMSSPVLVYSALKQPFRKVILWNGLESNRTVAETEYYDPRLAYGIIPGSLNHFDLPDLKSLMPGTTVIFANPLDASGKARGNTTDISQIPDLFNQ